MLIGEKNQKTFSDSFSSFEEQMFFIFAWGRLQKYLGILGLCWLFTESESYKTTFYTLWLRLECSRVNNFRGMAEKVGQ